MPEGRQPPGSRGHGRTLLVISQVYRPDPTSVGQHVADAAVEMARRGWRVRVLTSARGYEDPSVVYPSREVLDGVEVVRLPLSSGGKGSLAARLAGQVSFLGQVALRALFLRKVDAILVSTSPPMAAAAALVVGGVRRAPIYFWWMDLNPDQILQMGLATDSAPLVRAMNALNRAVLRRARRIVVLDRFMAERVRRKLDPGDRMRVMPPWPHESHLEASSDEIRRFRDEVGIGQRLAVMYSGNHSAANPLGTLLDAARALSADPRFVFVFVGAGGEKRKVEEQIAAGATNLLSLPYQPLERLGISLASGDLHVVTIGDGVVGIVHPCKVYGAMSVARPLLTFGPSECHLSDLSRGRGLGWHVAHGDVAGAVEAIRSFAALDAGGRAALGARGREAVRRELGQEALCGRFCDMLEERDDLHPAGVSPR